MKDAFLEGLKIPVSAVRFRLWAQGFLGKIGGSESPPSPPSPGRYAGRVPAGCQLLGILALGLSGCALEPPDWYGDQRFTPAERAAVEEGAAWLHERAGLPPPVIAWTYEVASSEALPRTIRREQPSTGPGGLCLGLEGTIYLDPATLVPGLAAHELAHCELGFVDGYHAGDVQTDGIMRVLAPMRWTHVEQEQCSRSTKCKTF